MNVVPLKLREANAFIAAHHRHNKPVRGLRFAIGAVDGGRLVGIATIGRPDREAQAVVGEPKRLWCAPWT